MRLNQPRNARYLVQTRSQVKSSGLKLPEIHGANKGLDPHVQPGKQRSFHHYLFKLLTKDCLHILFLSQGLVKAESD